MLVVSLNALVGTAQTNSSDSLGIDITDMVDTGGVVRSSAKPDIATEGKELKARDTSLTALIATGGVQDVEAPTVDKKTATSKASIEEELRKENAGNIDPSSSRDMERMKSMISTGGVSRTDAVPTTFDAEWMRE